MITENEKTRGLKYYYDEKNHERLKKQSRERYHKDSTYKEATLERAKKRYYADDEYREATIRRAKERYRRLKKVKIKSSLIAKCGMNCGLCYAFQREKNKCPGCRQLSAGMPVSIERCKIRTCGFFASGKAKFCYKCSEYPCKNLKHLDVRYKTKYGMSMVENLNNIKATGIRKFIASEQSKWACCSCGNLLSVHKNDCLTCGTAKNLAQ